MENKETTQKKNISVIAIVAFLVAVFLCGVELGLFETPLDAFFQRSSAILGVLVKPLMLVKKWLF